MKKLVYWMLLPLCVGVLLSCEREQFEFRESFWETDPDAELVRVDSFAYYPDMNNLLLVYYWLDTALLNTTPDVHLRIDHNHFRDMLFSADGRYFYMQRVSPNSTYYWRLYFEGHDGVTPVYVDTSFTTW